MQIRVEYVAQVRTSAGVESEELSVPDGATVQQLVGVMCETHPGLDKVLCGPDGGLHASILVFRGEDPCEPSTELADGDRLTFLSPISGG